MMLAHENKLMTIYSELSSEMNPMETFFGPRDLKTLE